MTEKEFQTELAYQLRRFSEEDRAQIADYYHELICDKIENEHITEKEAITSIGTVSQVASAAASELVASGKVKGAKAGIILLTICLSPLILPLSITVAALYIALFTVYAALIIAVCAVIVSCALSALAVWFLPGETMTKVFFCGCLLIVSALFVIIGYFLFKLGRRLLSLVTVRLAKKILRRNSEK